MTSENVFWCNKPDVEYPPLSKEFTEDVIDVVIIGGGLTGLSCAYHILKESPGTSVYVLEAKHVGYGASGRTSGILAERSAMSFANQIASQGVHKTLEDLQLKRKAIQHVKLIAKEVNAEFQEGRNYLYAGDLSEVQKEFDAMNQLGIKPVQFFDSKELQEKKLCSSFYEAAVLGPASWVHPYQLVSGLAKAVHAKGGYIFENTKVNKVKQTYPTIVKANGCELVVNTVILATNAYTPQLGFFKNRIIPVQTGILVTDKLSPSQLNSLGWKDREIIQEGYLTEGCTLQLTSDDRLFIRGTVHYQYHTLPLSIH
jgi:glycine/D-amino acid oxidase-like deaminating enzyme